jgi:hypothetical protein
MDPLIYRNHKNFKAVSEFSIFRHLSLELPAMEKVSQDSLLNANGWSSYSRNSMAMAFSWLGAEDPN